MSCLEPKICYCFLPRFAFVVCPDFVDLSFCLVMARSSASCLYFIAILLFKGFFNESACNHVSLVCNGYSVCYLTAFQSMSLAPSAVRASWVVLNEWQFRRYWYPQNKSVILSYASYRTASTLQRIVVPLAQQASQACIYIKMFVA